MSNSDQDSGDRQVPAGQSQYLTDDEISERIRKKRVSPLGLAFRDFTEAARLPQIWLTFAAEDLQQRYFRSGLGIAWIGVSFLIFLAGYIVIFGGLVGRDTPEIACYITLGFLTWNQMSSAITEGNQLFLSNSGWIKSGRLPLSLYSFQLSSRLCLNLLICGIASIISLFIFRAGLTESLSAYDIIFALLGVIMIILNTLWVQIFFGILCVRFRDAGHFISSIMRFIFFMSPVAWKPALIGKVGPLLYQLNPFTHFIEIVRHPLMEGGFPSEHWLIVAGISIVGFISTCVIFGLTYKKIPFWI